MTADELKHEMSMEECRALCKECKPKGGSRRQKEQDWDQDEAERPKILYPRNGVLEALKECNAQLKGGEGMSQLMQVSP